MNNGTNNNTGNNGVVNNTPNTIGAVTPPNPPTPNTNNSTPNPGFTVMLNDPKPTTPPQPSAPNPVNEPPISNPAPVNNQNPIPPTNVMGAVNLQSTPVSTPLENPVGTPVEPAYTNPQTITNSMPGFETGGVVGTTPPISLEAEKKPKKKGNNKLLFIILILALLVGIGVGTYYLLNNTNLFKKNNQITIETIDFETNIGDNLPDDINKYAKVTGTEITNCSYIVTGVNTKKAGVYDFEVTCGNVSRKGKITVIDNREVEVEGQVVYKKVGDTVEASEFGKVVNGMTATFEFIDQDTITNYLKNAGVYNVKIKAVSNNNSVEFDSKLIVLQYDVKKNYNCKLIENVKIDGYDALENQTYRFKISDSDTAKNIYGGLAQDIYEFIFNSKDDYDKVVNDYKTNKTIMLNGVEINQLNVSFNESTKTITVTNELNNQTLIAQHGADTFTTYSNLAKRFKTELGYNCIVENP